MQGENQSPCYGREDRVRGCVCTFNSLLRFPRSRWNPGPVTILQSQPNKTNQFILSLTRHGVYSAWLCSPHMSTYSTSCVGHHVPSFYRRNGQNPRQLMAQSRLRYHADIIWSSVLVRAKSTVTLSMGCTRFSLWPTTKLYFRHLFARFPVTLLHNATLNVATHYTTLQYPDCTPLCFTSSHRKTL